MGMGGGKGNFKMCSFKAFGETVVNHFSILQNKLTLNKFYIYHLDRDSLIEDLVNNGKYDVERLSENRFRFFDNNSAGIFVSNNTFAPPLHIDLTIQNVSEKELGLHFTSGIRKEHAFIALMMISSLFVLVKQNARWYVFAFIVGIWIISHWWFQFIYREQEKAIMHYLRKKLYWKEKRILSGD